MIDVEQASRYFAALILSLFLAAVFFTSEASCQDWEEDCGGVPCNDEDSLSVLDSLEAPADTASILYPPFFGRDPVAPQSTVAVADSIHLGRQHMRIHHSMNDALRRDMRFYPLERGPRGQSYSLSYRGLPPYMLNISPDSPGSYHALRIPPVGIMDLRLHGLEQADEILLIPYPNGGSYGEVVTYRRAPNYSVPYTEISLFRGDYSFSNASVKFRRPVGDRLAWGAAVGIERSNGYLLGSEKERQDYALQFAYKLTPGWQVYLDGAFQNVNDEVAGLGLERYTSGRRDATFQDFGLTAIRKDSLGNESRVQGYFRSFEDKLRNTPYLLRQRHEVFSLGHNSVREFDAFRFLSTGRLDFRGVWIDQAHETYTVLDMDGGIELKELPHVTPFVGGGILLGYNEKLYIDANASLGWKPHTSISGTFGGRLSHIPPSDLARWLPKTEYDFDLDSVSEYVHAGGESLRPTRSTSLFGSIGYTDSTVNLEAGAEVADLSGLVIWDSDLSAPALFNASATNATLLSGTLSGTVMPFDPVRVDLDYCYSRIEDDDDYGLGLMPRHNLFARLFWKTRIDRFNLTTWPSVEFEYHSENYIDYLNPEVLDDYALLHVKLSVKLKSFTFYYSMENVLDVEYETLYGYPSGRSVWWGFRWMFDN